MSENKATAKARIHFDPLAHEAAVVARIDQERQSIIDARDAVGPAVDAHDEAEMNLATIEAKISKADGSVAIEDLAQAEVAVRYAELVKAGAEQRANRVKRKDLPKVSKLLPEALASSVAKSLKDRVKVVPTYAVPRPADVAASASQGDLPMVWVGMGKGGLTADAGGVLGGTVEVLQIRDELLRALDEPTISKALAGHGFDIKGVMDAGTVELGNAVEADRIEIDVAGAWNPDPDSLPVVGAGSGRPGEGRLPVAGAIAGIGSSDLIGGSVRAVSRGDGGAGSSSDTWLVGPSYAARDLATKVVSDDTDADGVRTVTVRHTVAIEGQDGRSAVLKPGQPTSPVEAIKGTFDVPFLPGYGRIESVDVKGSASGDSFVTTIITKSQTA